jgi:hypothetical protein
VSEGGLVIHERVIARGDGGVAARLQVSQGVQRAEDAPADRLHRRLFFMASAPYPASEHTGRREDTHATRAVHRTISELP